MVAALLGFAAFDPGLRLALAAILVVVNLRAIRRTVLLSARGSIVALGWSEGGFTATTRQSGHPFGVVVAAGSFRLGQGVLFLRLVADRGKAEVLVDMGLQEPAALRALLRRLRRAGGAAGGLREARAVTIPPKV